MSQTAFKGEAITGPSLTLVSSSGKRMFPRVDQPLLITFDTGERFQARDWSVAGFSLPDGGFSSAKGAVHRVWLSIALSDCNIVVEADAKVSWVSGGSARGFRFIGLSSDKTRILDHFIESGIEGDTAVGYLPLQPRIAGLAHGRVKAGLLRAAQAAKQASKLLVLTGVVLAGGVFVVGRLFTVTTDYAAVAADLQQLHAPESGYLRGGTIETGAHFRVGQRIGQIEPVATPQQRLSTETEIAALQTSLDQQNAALDQAKAGFETFLRSARTDLEEAESGRKMLESQVAAENKVYLRYVSLQQKGIVAEQRTDEEQQVLLTLQRSLATARDAEGAMRQKLDNAEAGRFSSDGRSTQKSPADLRDEARTTEASLGRLKAMLSALDEPLPILSPCDCTVSALSATPGSFVASGAAIADLAQDGNGHVAIDALVQNPRLNLVRQDQVVTVYLADRPEGVAGHVAGINFNPNNTGRIGLPASLKTLDDYGVMTVEIDAPMKRLASGLPASVSAPITWTALSANLPALRWANDVGTEIGREARALWSTLPTAGDIRSSLTSIAAHLHRPA